MQYLSCGACLFLQLLVTGTTRVSRIRHPPDFSRALRVRAAIIKHRGKRRGAIASRYRLIGKLLLLFLFPTHGRELLEAFKWHQNDCRAVFNPSCWFCTPVVRLVQNPWLSSARIHPANHIYSKNVTYCTRVFKKWLYRNLYMKTVIFKPPVIRHFGRFRI